MYYNSYHTEKSPFRISGSNLTKQCAESLKYDHQNSQTKHSKVTNRIIRLKLTKALSRTGPLETRFRYQFTHDNDVIS